MKLSLDLKDRSGGNSEFFNLIKTGTLEKCDLPHLWHLCVVLISALSSSGGEEYGKEAGGVAWWC